MLSEKEKDKILRLRQEGLSYNEIHKKTKNSVNTIMDICRKKVEKSQKKVKESQEKAKKQEVHFDNPIDKVSAIPNATPRIRVNFFPDFSIYKILIRIFLNSSLISTFFGYSLNTPSKNVLTNLLASETASINVKLSVKVG